MSEVDIWALHEQCQSAFRLEARNRYSVEGEREQFRAFQEGRPLPDHPDIARTMELIRSFVDAGKTIRRVHVLDQPLTPYLRYELAVYPENVEAGEEIHIADRAWAPELEELTDDFVLFDAETDEPSVVWYDYDADGGLEGYRYSESRADIDRCIRHRDVALEHAVPLEQFTALADAG